MTPKEKAKQIHDKFDSLLPCEGTTTGQTPIECALICVDEVLKTFNINWSWCSVDTTDKERWKKEFDFWTEVKQEIEKL